MRRRLTLVAHAALLSTTLLFTALPHAATLPAAAPAIAWLEAAADADVDRAFGQARGEHKPLLLYWGAKWCPPCNQLKATLFNRQDFITLSKNFVAVHVDGDLPGAQKLGARFKVRGYPTLILMNPQGQELTRLPGEADAPQVLALLQHGLAGGRPVQAVLADARAGKALQGSEWRALALYSWATDEQQLVPEGERPALLAQLSAACPASEAEASMRLLLKALAVSDDGKGLKPDAKVRERVRKLLADPAASRVQMDTVVNYPAEITRALAPAAGAEQRTLAAAFDAALKQLQADATLSRADRSQALAGRVDLARIGQAKEERHPKLNAALLQQVRELSQRDDREITDPYERQAVITTDAGLLGEAGLWTESDALLKANLAKSHSPYYLMSQLGSNARKLGRKDEALRWYAQAFDKSEGPATRLQWGASYFTALVELAPQDATRIEKTAAQLFTEAAQDKGAFYERSARSLKRVSGKLAEWNGGGKHAAILERLQQRLTGVCGKLEAADAQRATCDALAKSLAAKPLT